MGIAVWQNIAVGCGGDDEVSQDIDAKDEVSARSGLNLCWKISIACLSSFRADLMCLSRMEISPVVRSKKFTRDSYRLNMNFNCGSGAPIVDAVAIGLGAAPEPNCLTCDGARE